MGNTLYRPSPRRIFYAEEGNSSYFRYGANQITGWRHSQEDRYVCMVNFYKNLSFFGVYDGHGGEQVAQYLQRFLHQHIYKELERSNDIELGLYLGFLNCDSSLRSITDAEYAVIEKDLEKEFEIPDKEERRKILFGLGNRKSTDSAESSEGGSDDLRAAVASACISQLPSITYLTQSPEEESDERDEDYEPGDTDCNFLDTSDNELDQNEEPEEKDVSSENNEMDTNEDFSTSSDVSDQNEELEDKDASNENSKLRTNNKVGEKEIVNASSSTAEDDEVEKEEKESTGDSEVMDKQIGVHCGSTATVVLMDQKNVYIAHVGDSRCVACVNGQAVHLCFDHRPTDIEEHERIIGAGGTVSEDGRIEGDIDMSRAFGDFRYKSEDDDPLNILSVAPSISVFELTSDLEFIIVASDGIWNTVDSSDVIHYIKNRIQDSDMELQDVCGELFLEMIPNHVTDDGSGCDNMTAIVIQFMNTAQKNSSCSIGCNQTVYEYAKQCNNVLKKNVPESQNQKQVLPTQNFQRCSTRIDSSEQIGTNNSICNEISDEVVIIGESTKQTKYIGPIQVIEDISSSSSQENEAVEHCEVIPTDDGHNNYFSRGGNMELPLAAIPAMLPNQQSDAIYYQEDCPQAGQSHIAEQQEPLGNGAPTSKDPRVTSLHLERSHTSAQQKGNETTTSEDPQIPSLQAGPSQQTACSCNKASTSKDLEEPIIYFRSMTKMLQSVMSSQTFFQSAHSCLASLQVRLEKEISRFNNKFLDEFPYVQNSNDEKEVEPINSSLEDLANKGTSQNVQTRKRTVNEDINSSKKKKNNDYTSSSEK